MSRPSLRTGLRAALLVAILELLVSGQPAQAQFLKNLKKYAQKAQEIHKSTTITDQQEKEIGREVAAKFIDYFHIYKNDPVTRYVNLVGQAVAAQSERQDIQYHFAVLDSVAAVEHVALAAGVERGVDLAVISACEDKPQALARVVVAEKSGGARLEAAEADGYDSVNRLRGSASRAGAREEPRSGREDHDGACDQD